MSKYAAALDRLQPLIFNFYNQGETWKKYGITSDRVLSFNQHIEEGSEKLWDFAKELIEEAVEKNYLSQK